MLNPYKMELPPMFPFILAVIVLCILIGSVILAYGDEWVDYKEWSFVNHSMLIEKYNHGESYGAYLVPDTHKSLIMASCFGYTTYPELINRWEDKRAPRAIYAYYLKHKDKLWNPVNGKFLVVE